MNNFVCLTGFCAGKTLMNFVFTFCGHLKHCFGSEGIVRHSKKKLQYQRPV